jgi:hypothetical protein
MRVLAAMLLLVTLAGCQSWDWRAAGRSLIYSACYTIANCSASDGALDAEE